MKGLKSDKPRGYFPAHHRILDTVQPIRPYHTGRGFAVFDRGVMQEVLGVSFKVPGYTDRIYEAAGIKPDQFNYLDTIDGVSNGSLLRKAEKLPDPYWVHEYADTYREHAVMVCRVLAAQRLAVVWAMSSLPLNDPDEHFLTDWNDFERLDVVCLMLGTFAPLIQDILRSQNGAGADYDLPLMPWGKQSAGRRDLLTTIMPKDSYLNRGSGAYHRLLSAEWPFVKQLNGKYDVIKNATARVGRVFTVQLLDDLMITYGHDGWWDDSVCTPVHQPRSMDYEEGLKHPKNTRKSPRRVSV